MKRRKLKRKTIIFIIIIIIFAFIGIMVKSFFFNNNNKIINTEIHKEVWPKISKISLLATGDALLHNAVYHDAYDKNTGTFNFSQQLSLIKDIVNNYDIAYYNQESVFGGYLPNLFPDNSTYQVRGYSSYPYFNSPSEFGDAMVDIGFNMVSLASNHSADCKYNSDICIPNSYNYWSKKNVVFDGFNEDENQENKYNINEINGITYGFLNYTNTLNGLDSTIKNINYMIDVWDDDKVYNEITELRKKVDVLIVGMHWHKNSSEYSFTPTKSNIEIANYLNTLGVDVILGTYSHCLQPFDIIDTNNHKTVVFYSLGNLISNQGDLISSIGYKGIVGVLATMDITKTEYEDGHIDIVIDNIGADLTYTYHLSGYKNYLVVPFSKMNSTYNKDYISIYKDYSEVLTALNKNINIAEISQ